MIPDRENVGIPEDEQYRLPEYIGRLDIRGRPAFTQKLNHYTADWVERSCVSFACHSEWCDARQRYALFSVTSTIRKFALRRNACIAEEMPGNQTWR